MNNNDIVDHFDQYFEMVSATSDELKKEAYKLRYQVYCIENNFESSSHFPDKMEFDEFDERSIHYLIRHRKSGAYAATVRLIIPDANNPKKLFPVEQYCEIDNYAAMDPINREHLGEASRLCVSKEFKKRRSEANTLAAIGPDRQNFFTLDERRSFPHISFALIASLIKACYENDIYYFLGSLEPAWFRFLSAAGINFTKIGPLTDYHGDRWPGVIKVTDLLDGVANKNLDIWNLLTNKGSILQDKPNTSPIPPIALQKTHSN